MGLVLTLMAGMGWAAAGEVAPRPPTAIGIVQIEKVFGEYKYLQDLHQQLEREFTPQMEAIIQATEAVEARRARLAANRRIIPPGSEGFEQERRAIENEEYEVDRRQQRYFRDLGEKQSAGFVAAFQALQRASDQYVLHHKYDLIMHTPSLAIPDMVRNSGNTDAVIQEIFVVRRVLALSPGIDLTDNMILYLNQRYEAHKLNPRSPL